MIWSSPSIAEKNYSHLKISFCKFDFVVFTEKDRLTTFFFSLYFLSEKLDYESGSNLCHRSNSNPCDLCFSPASPSSIQVSILSSIQGDLDLILGSRNIFLSDNLSTDYYYSEMGGVKSQQRK